MDGDRVDAVTEWETVSVGRGHRGLRDLADEGFSGAVTDGRAWALLTNGKVVGVTDGDVEDFADAALTAHRAPDPALPLLFAMQERGGETRARYYTNETSISAADETLSGGGFTGYIELSENVLSGDYYVVYYGGEAMPVAFVGNSRRLLTGDEAFERADDEVGIYEVRDVDVDVVDIPGGGSESGGATGVAAAGAGAASDDPDPTAADESEDVVVTSQPEGRDAEGAGATAAGSGVGEDAVGGSDAEDGGDVGADDGVSGGETADGSDGGDDGTASDAEPDWPTPDLAREPDEGEDSTEERDANVSESASTGTETEADPSDSTEQEAPETQGTATEPTERSTLDPDLTTAGQADRSSDTTGETEAGDDAATTDAESTGRADESTDAVEAFDSDASETAEAAADDGTAEAAAATDRVETLATELEETRERLEAVRTERDDLRGAVERLRERVAELERELEDARAAADDGAGGHANGTSMSAGAALAGTNLFVRYRSKAEPTLADARDGSTDPEAVNENLRIEHHTTFDDEDATVDGRPFVEFLESSVEYRFVRWLVRELPYELRGVDSRGGLGKLFEAIPSFDRIDLEGTVEGDEEEWSFDAVVRDRHGAPLVVVDVHDDRTPAGESTLASLVDAAKAACAEHESLGGAMVVTTSYFAPDALERAEVEAAGGGLFGRGSRESYVRLDRSRGFHLCLIEARDGDYHLSVPDL